MRQVRFDDDNDANDNDNLFNYFHMSEQTHITRRPRLSTLLRKKHVVYNI